MFWWWVKHDKGSAFTVLWKKQVVHCRVGTVYSGYNVLQYTDGSEQDCGNSSASAPELPQSCAKPLIWYQTQTQSMTRIEHMACNVAENDNDK